MNKLPKIIDFLGKNETINEPSFCKDRDINGAVFLYTPMTKLIEDLMEKFKQANKYFIEKGCSVTEFKGLGKFSSLELHNQHFGIFVKVLVLGAGRTQSLVGAHSNFSL